MEVDLTDDDIIITSQHAPQQTAKSAPQQAAKSSQQGAKSASPRTAKAAPQRAAVSTPQRASTSAPQRAAKPVQAPQQNAPPLETVEISDDDDIIFEDDVRFKTTPSQKKSEGSQTVGKTLPKAVPQKPSIGGTPQEKAASNEDILDVDDVIEVLDTPSKAPVKDKTNVSQDKSISVNSLALSNKVQKTSSNNEAMEVDDIIEVVEEPCQLAAAVKPNCSKDTAVSVSAPGKPNTVEPLHGASNQDQTNPGRDQSLQGIPSVKSSAPVSCPPKGNGGEGDEVIELEGSPPKSPHEPLSCGKDSLVALESSSEKSNKNTKKTEGAARYVIDITDDDSAREKDRRKPENTCLNVSCKSGEDLASAAMFVISYYGCKLKKGKYDVCAQCFDAALDHHKELAGRLLLQKPLLSYENFPVNDIPMVDLESDEEMSDPESPLPFSLLQDVEQNLEEVLKESLTKFDLDYQISEASGILSEKMTSLELEAKKIDDAYDSLQKQIDSMRLQVYKKHNPIIKELPSLELTAYTPPFFSQHSEAYPYGTSECPPRGVAMKRVTHMSSLRSITPISTRPDGSSQEVVALEEVDVPHTPLPPIGNLLRPKPRANDVVYVMKMSFFGVWLKGRVVEVNHNANPAPMIQTVYKVKMENSLGNRKQFSIKSVQGRHMAYPNPAPVRLSVGTRVIAVFQDDESHNQNKGGSYYSGLIAEPPKSNNRFRYLVFFDDGYAQYVPHNKILVVCETSRNVWDDIHPDSREFIRKYLEKYPERPMVKLAANQVVKTEWNGKWWIARVVEVDGSLVKMSFDADKRTEWIYRGSTRLAPLFTELSRQESGTISRMRGMGVRRVNQPYVEYTHTTTAEDDTSEQPHAHPASASPPAVRAVAKKSTSKKNEMVTHIPPTLPPISRFAFFSPENIGNVKELQLPKDAPMPKRLQTHSCGPQCIEWIKYDLKRMNGYNPLSVPLYCGWQRELPKFRKKTTVLYTAPCGRRLRNMEELHKYLRMCRSTMSVDLFDFDYWVNALSEFTLSEKVKQYIVNEDISSGREKVKIPLVNYVDHSVPTTLIYKTQRQPFDNVFVNDDPSFLCGCDCTDDCQNKEKCACWQLTIQGSALYPGGVADPDVGYFYKRLQERVITGIYECNAQCKCSKKTCLNRVVQHPLQLRLQLFKTPNKGWGLRCVNDIPKGTFICIYAGYLYTEQTANTIGEQEGDDYLAELDYIEVVERMKEDYESDVEDAEEDEDDFPQLNKSNDDKRHSKSRNKEEADSEFKVGWRSSTDKNSDASIRSRLRKRNAADIDSEDENKSGDKGNKRKDSSQKNDGDDDGSDDEKEERQPSSFTPKPLRKPANVTAPPIHRFQSVRKFYGPNERVYIMDANKVGNIGRYLNHSCSPNVFVQNVFVDTHDLRFPWVAFFALTYIKAGSELTWDYNYDVGSVPGKTIFCQCGSSECRGRLL